MIPKHLNRVKPKPVSFTLALTILLAVATVSFAADTSGGSHTLYAMMGGGGGGMMSGGGMMGGNDMRDGRSRADGNSYTTPYRPDTRPRQPDLQRFENQRDVSDRDAPNNDARAQKPSANNLNRYLPPALIQFWERLKNFNF